MHCFVDLEDYDIGDEHKTALNNMHMMNLSPGKIWCVCESYRLKSLKL